MRPLARYCKELLEFQAWETWFHDEPKTWDRLCNEVIGYSVEFISTIQDGVWLLESSGDRGPIGRQEACAAARDNPIAKHGEVGNGRESRVDNVKSTQGGNDQSYLARRLARDRPDILDRVESGEIASFHAAAIEAGIVERKVQIPVEPGRAAKLIRKHFSSEQVEALILLLGE